MSQQPIISLTNVKKSYNRGQVKALQDIDLSIPPRCFLALAGPSGSGKTTLLNIIGALDVPDEGTVVVDGRRIEELDEKDRTRLRRERIGFIFQQFNLVPVLTARENVELPLEILPGYTKAERRQTAMDILEKVGLGGKTDRLPSELSGGEQQRVAVARALVKKPVFVLADEPTANLDGKTGQIIVEIMKQMRETLGTAFILSTHDQRVIRQTETVVRLVDGRIDK